MEWFILNFESLEFSVLHPSRIELEESEWRQPSLLLSCAGRTCRGSPGGSRTCRGPAGSRWWQTCWWWPAVAGSGCTSPRWRGGGCSCSASVAVVEGYAGKENKQFGSRTKTLTKTRQGSGPPWTPWGCTSHFSQAHCRACCRTGGWARWGGWRPTQPTAGSGGGSRKRPAQRAGWPPGRRPGPRRPAGTRWTLEDGQGGQEQRSIIELRAMMFRGANQLLKY